MKEVWVFVRIKTNVGKTKYKDLYDALFFLSNWIWAFILGLDVDFDIEIKALVKQIIWQLQPWPPG